MPKARRQKHSEGRAALPSMIGREDLLIYYQHHEDWIVQYLRITQPKKTLLDEDKAGIASAYLDAVSG